MSSPTEPSVNVAGTGGAMYLTLQFAAVLWGVTTFQCWVYARTAYKDTAYLKATVLLVWLLNTAHQCIDTYCVWYYLVRNFGEPNALHREIPAVLWQVFVVSAVTFLVQSVYVWRLWILSHKNKVLVFGISFTVVANFLLGIGTTAYAFVIGAHFNSRSDEGVIVACFALVVPTDLAITCSMSYFLYKSRTGFRQTNSMVQTLLAYTISTGLFPSIFVVAIIICRVIETTTRAYVALHFLLSALYANSMLFVLNNRRHIREKYDHGLRQLSFPVFTAGSDTTVQPSTSNTQSMNGKGRTNSKLEVIVERADVVETDYSIGTRKANTGSQHSDVEWTGDELNDAHAV